MLYWSHNDFPLITDTLKQGRQEDAEEFLGFLLDGMHEELAAGKYALDCFYCLNLFIYVHMLFSFVALSNNEGDVKEKDVDGNNGWLEVGPKNRTNLTRAVKDYPY